MFNKFCLLVVFIFSANCFAYIPPGFEQINSASGWNIYSNGETYVQKIDLRHRILKIIVGEKDSNEPYGFKKFDLQTKFKTLKKSGALSVSNGSFFDNYQEIFPKYAGISYPFNNLTYKEHGWSTNGNEDTLKVFAWGIFPPLTKMSAQVFDYNKTFEDNSLYKNAYYITGKDPDYDQGGKKNNDDYRTFIGVKDKYYVYLLNGKDLTQKDARLIFQDFGLYQSNIVMIDGGSSTQLSFKNANNSIENKFTGSNVGIDRNLPQVLAVYG